MSQSLVHNVYFTLEDPTPASIAHLVEQGHEYLSGHPGVEYFSMGTLVEDLERPVNDRDFHVALSVVFIDRAAHDTYQVSQRHVAFIENNKETWAEVRVFDARVVEAC